MVSLDNLSPELFILRHINSASEQNEPLLFCPFLIHECLLGRLPKLLNSLDNIFIKGSAVPDLLKKVPCSLNQKGLTLPCCLDGEVFWFEEGDIFIVSFSLSIIRSPRECIWFERSLARSVLKLEVKP